MPSPQITDYKALLAAKMDSKEKYLEFAGINPMPISSSWYANSGCADRQGPRIYNAAWWLMREHYRIKAGIYNVTQAIDRINNSWAAHYAVHISKDDDTMVAYTPSTEAGEADKQIKTTFGKFLRRHFISLTDAQIQQMEQDHRAELTAVMQIATTRDDIERVYTTMDGDSGCMRYSPMHFGIYGVHPSAAYEAPGMGVAFTELDGQVKSRAVVWTNPADPSDKRYVRVYGDPVLKRLLEREGYTCDSLNGAQIRKIPRITSSSGEPNQYEYVVPYLDGPGGRQEGRSGVYVVDEGGDYLRLTDEIEYNAIKNGSLPYSSTPYIALAKSTSAYIKIKPLLKAEFTSDLTGITYQGYSQRQVPIWLAHAKRIGVCHQSELPLSYSGVYVVGVDEDGDKKIVQVQADPQSLKTFEYRYSTYHDTDEMRHLRGYVRLSDKYYGGAWFQGSVCTLSDGSKIKSDDAVVVLTAEGGVTHVHESEVAAMRKQGFVNAASIDGRSVIISKARATAHRTKSGTWFCSEVHKERYVFTVQGEWMAKGSAYKFHLFGQHLYSSTSSDAGIIAALPQGVVVDAFKACTYGCDVEAIMSTLHAGSLTAVGATSTIQYIEGRVLRSLQAMGGYTWAVAQDADGAVQIGEYYQDITLAGVRKFAAAMSQIGTNMVSHVSYEAMVSQAHLFECLDAHIAPHIAVLKHTLDQQAMEAAGQVRIEEAMAPAAPANAPTFEELCAA